MYHTKSITKFLKRQPFQQVSGLSNSKMCKSLENPMRVLVFIELLARIIISTRVLRKLCIELQVPLIDSLIPTLIHIYNSLSQVIAAGRDGLEWNPQR